MSQAQREICIHTGLPQDWGVVITNGIEMHVWIYSDAHLDDWIDARAYCADFDLPMRRRRRKIVVEVTE